MPKKNAIEMEAAEKTDENIADSTGNLDLGKDKQPDFNGQMKEDTNVFDSPKELNEMIPVVDQSEGKITEQIKKVSELREAYSDAFSDLMIKDEEEEDYEAAKAEVSKLKSELQENNRRLIQDIFEQEFVTLKDMTAVDENGRFYEGSDEILDRLSDPLWTDKLYVYEKDAEYPMAIESDSESGILISKDPVSLDHPFSDFDIKPSLKYDDICNGPENIKEIHEFQKMETQYKNAQAILRKDKHVDNVYALRQTPQNHFDEKVKKIHEPDKPDPMTTGQKIKRFFVKVITLGFGETKEGQIWKNYNKDMAEYNRKRQIASDEYKKEKDKIETKIKKAKEDIEKLGPQVKKAKEKLLDDLGSNNIRKLNEYHEHMEVRLEGIKDINKNGLTGDNLFAQVWLLKNKLEGKPLKEDLYEELAAYLVLASMEKRFMNRELKSTGSAERTESIFSALKDELLIEKTMKTTPFKKILGSYGNKEINLNQILEDFNIEVNQATSDFTALDKLNRFRKELIQKFGEKEISEDCLADIARLNQLDEEIKLAEVKGEKYSMERGKEVLTDLTQKPESRTRVIIWKNYFNAEYKKALSDVGNNVTRTKETMENLKREMKQKDKAAANSEGPTKLTLMQTKLPDVKTKFSLEEMRDMVNEQVKVNAREKSNSKHSERGLSL